MAAASVEAIRRRAKFRFVALLALYGALIGVSSAWRDELSDRVAIALALVAAAAASWALVTAMRAERTVGGFERHVLVESTSVAFVITMVSSITWGLLEAYAEVERPSAWSIYGIGMISWGVTATVLNRRSNRES